MNVQLNYTAFAISKEMILANWWLPTMLTGAIGMYAGSDFDICEPERPRPGIRYKKSKVRLIAPIAPRYRSRLRCSYSRRK